LYGLIGNVGINYLFEKSIHVMMQNHLEKIQPPKLWTKTVYPCVPYHTTCSYSKTSYRIHMVKIVGWNLALKHNGLHKSSVRLWFYQLIKLVHFVGHKENCDSLSMWVCFLNRFCIGDS